MYKKITARELADKQDSDDDSYTVIDTRPEDSYEAWRVPGAKNIPFGPAETIDEDKREAVDEIVQGGKIITICGKGATSSALAAELDTNGYDDVAVVKGGMRDWNSLYETTRVDTENDDLLIVQFQRRAKGCLSYLIGELSTGEAVVVDPTRHIDQYVTRAAEEGLEIMRVLDTHIHADHISGGHTLAAKLNVPYHLGEHATEREIDYEFEPMADGDTISVGELKVEVLHAPGHTSEMVTYRIDDEAVLTGDALFLDSIGRTELEFGEDEAEKGARMQYETLHDTLLELPDDLLVLPGHVTVNNDGTYENGSPGELIGAALAEVHASLSLIDLDEEGFVKRMIENIPAKPDNYETIISINQGGESVDSSRDATMLETGANNCAA
ncbi:MBL fold metallo-hydrolase [Haloarcula nitratireducens]|uniref:MBL fold metallo-hydrolase n=1 Tax=Haloarcula nitratireducens TaxID=2487749 RepID=A0AAW4PH25_9EURY|nr:rhodanese-like domain-containing protein [Halomicroarcula nitratireducens]MBX0296740.1 MBL fold metallo-hydrolase [Halomicroarcula nitratireducens]